MTATASANPLSHRVKILALQPADLFHLPNTELDRKFYSAGETFHWFRTGTDRFRGFTLGADPHHRKLGRISFLLGSDCSSFVHRLYQILGAAYSPGIKTRHFYHLYRAQIRREDPLEYYRSQAVSGTPIDLPIVDWQEVYDQFKIADRANPGDLRLSQPRSGQRGERGHIGLVLQEQLLHASQKRGVVADSLPKSGRYLRWNPKYPLLDRRLDLALLLVGIYPYDPRTEWKWCQENLI